MVNTNNSPEGVVELLRKIMRLPVPRGSARRRMTPIEYVACLYEVAEELSPETGYTDSLEYAYGDLLLAVLALVEGENDQTIRDAFGEALSSLKAHAKCKEAYSNQDVATMRAMVASQSTAIEELRTYNTELRRNVTHLSRRPESAIYDRCHVDSVPVGGETDD